MCEREERPARRAESMGLMQSTLGSDAGGGHNNTRT